MNYTALIPVKSLTEAKSRLAPYLTHEERANLMLDMLHHVLSVLQKSNIFAHVTVVSPDNTVLEFARSYGALTYKEEQHGHNPALTAAARRELANGSNALLAISADLPLLHSDDIHAMIEQARYAQVVVAPSHEGTGTNALLTRPPLVIPYLFGPGSLQRHQAEATRLGLASRLVARTGLAVDIDTIDDLTAFPWVYPEDAFI